MVKLTDFIKMLPANAPDGYESETERIIRDIEGVDDLADIANAIGIEVHLIKQKRGRPKANTDNEPKPAKEKKPVGRPKKEKTDEPKVLKKRGRKPIPKPEKVPVEKKPRGRKPKPKELIVLTDAERLKRKEKFIKQMSVLANIIDNFDHDLISKII